jgi:hypothetical protein
VIDVRQAAQAALQFARYVYGDEFARASLEEVELAREDGEWLITLGVRRKIPVYGAGFPEVEEPEPSYKIFRVEAETGEVRGMKIRET